jgi:hypothetical protein
MFLLLLLIFSYSTYGTLALDIRLPIPKEKM